MDNKLVECFKLHKEYGNVVALDSVDLTLESGKIIGLAGPNSAGKTTLIKILQGLVQPDSGAVSVCGMTPCPRTKAMVSYMADRASFQDWMKVQDSIDLYTDFFADFDTDKAKDICSTLRLNPNDRIKTLSKGTKEKLQLMLVMSRRAKLYLMDEPLAGVDPAAREFIMQTILSDYHEDGTILISTHLITDVEKMLDETVFMNQGRIILHRSVDEIRETEGKSVDELFRDMFRYQI